MDVQLAEVGRKPALLLRGQRLAAEEQDLVFDQQFAEAVDGWRRQFIGQPDTLDDRAQRGGNAGNRDGHGTRLRRWLMLDNAHADSITQRCATRSQLRRRSPQPSSMFISAAILTVAKVENVSDTAYGRMIWSLCRMAPQV